MLVSGQKKKALTTGIVKTFVAREAGFERASSCGSRKNLRAIRLLDFFDRCAIPCSLYRPLDAVAGDAFGPSVVGFQAKRNPLTTGMVRGSCGCGGWI